MPAQYQWQDIAVSPHPRALLSQTRHTGRFGPLKTGALDRDGWTVLFDLANRGTTAPARPERPYPEPTPLTRPFWNGAAEGKLLYQTARHDGRPISPLRSPSPRTTCPPTWSGSSRRGWAPYTATQ